MTITVGQVKIDVTDVVIKLLRRPTANAAMRQLRLLTRWLSRESGPITLKILAYTSQATLSMVSQLFTQGQDVVKDRDVQIQLLRPNLQEPLRIWNVNEENDEQYWHLVQGAARDLDAVWLRIPEESYGRLDVTIKVHKFDPLFKAVFVNDRYALVGNYVLERHTKRSPVECTSWDYVGYKTAMIELHASDKRAGGRFFRWVLSYFDRTWRDFSEACIMAHNP